MHKLHCWLQRRKTAWQNKMFFSADVYTLCCFYNLLIWLRAYHMMVTTRGGEDVPWLFPIFFCTWSQGRRQALVGSRDSCDSLFQPSWASHLGAFVEATLLTIWTFLCNEVYAHKGGAKIAYETRDWNLSVFNYCYESCGGGIAWWEAQVVHNVSCLLVMEQ